MRKNIFIIVLCIFNSTVYAEYEELESIKKLSRDRLSEYSKRLIEEDQNLVGVINFAQQLQGVLEPNDIAQKNISKLTYENGDYWRAVLEKTPKDSSILYTHAYLYGVCGEFAYSDICFLLGSINVDENIRKELDSFKELRDKLQVRLSNEIIDGIKLHDQGEYKKAIEVYDRAIAEYPEGALFYYEKGLSYMMMDMNDPNLKDNALELYQVCREKDPFFYRAYQGSDPNVINKLEVLLEKVAPFYTGEKRNKEGFANFAEGCEQMELYPFAAHSRLKLSLIDPENAKEHMEKFFDMIGKSGCKRADLLRKMFILSESTNKQSQDNWTEIELRPEQ